MFNISGVLTASKNKLSFWFCSYIHFDVVCNASLCFVQDTWLYHLIVASAGGHGAIDTGSRAVSDYEQLVLNLMFIDADSTSSYWNDACLLHIKEPTLSRPLTTLHSDELQKKALDMFKACISFDFQVAGLVFEVQSVKPSHVVETRTVTTDDI